MYKKMDYYSVVLDGASLGSVLEVFGYDPRVLDGSDGLDMASVFSTSRMVAPAGSLKLQLALPCCRIQIPIAALAGCGVLVKSAEQVKPVDGDFDGALVTSVVDAKVSGLRVELAGNELDNMRLLGLVPEEMFADPVFWIANGVAVERRVTRVDFAYDFLDYPEEIARKLCVHVNEQVAAHDKGYRFYLDDKSSSMICRSAFSADETCAYLGKSGSGNVQFVRVYDKMQERQHQIGDQSLWPLYMHEDYRKCLSWFRFELQARGDKAHNLLFRRDPITSLQLVGEDMMDEVWFFLSSHYCLCTDDKKPLPWLRAFYDEICDKVREDAKIRKMHQSEILCNLGSSLGGIECGYKVTKESLGELERIFKFFEKNKSNICELIALWGVSKLVEKCNEHIANMQDADTAAVLRQKVVFNSRMDSACVVLGVPRSQLAGASLDEHGSFRLIVDKIDSLGPPSDEEIDVVLLYDADYFDPSLASSNPVSFSDVLPCSQKDEDVADSFFEPEQLSIKGIGCV